MRYLLAVLACSVACGHTAPAGRLHEQTSTPSIAIRSASDAPGVGFFHFREHAQLDATAVAGSYVRIAIEWDELEPEPGRFDWDNRQARKIERLLEAGFRVLPSIRARSRWAVDPASGSCASPPRDLDRGTPLRDRGSYSRSYFAFVTEIARHYQGRLDLVVIENEMNDEVDMWCGSVDDYLRVFATAKSALRAVDATIRVGDGGVQGVALNWLHIDELLRAGRTDDALHFYRTMSGEPSTLDALQARAADFAEKSGVVRARALYDGPLYEWVDVVNFHYYQRADAVPPIVAFLRRRAPDRPLMTNEIGIKEHLAEGPAGAAAELVKKIARLIALEVRPVIWFGPRGERGMNAGALIDDDGALAPETSSAFQLASRWLSAPATVRDASDEHRVRLQFERERERVDVTWPVSSEPVPNGCTAHVVGGEVSLVVCPR